MAKQKVSKVPVVSIIIPVYGVEQYIATAIKSVQAQTFTAWEMILVDDGSKDRSGEICDEFAQEDPRIRVIHKENGGAPSARNAGMEQASGKYFYFMDGDDWTEAGMLTDMVNLAEKNDSQLVVTGYYIDTYYSDTDKYQQEQTVPDAVFATQQAFREQAYDLFDKNLLYTPWNKLFRTDYIRGHNLTFPNTFMDDFPFVLSVVRDVERVAVSSQKYYHFIRKREESETAKYRDNLYQKREDEDDWMHELYRHWGITGGAAYDRAMEMIDRRYIERLIGCIENVTNRNCTLSRHKKKMEIHRMICSPRAQAAVRSADPRSGYMKAMLVPVRLKQAGLMYVESTVISRVKAHNTKLFAELKAGR